MEKKEYHWGTGRRKSSIARVRICRGSGDIIVNGREFKNYFTMERDKNYILAPLIASNLNDKVDVRANMIGGGVHGQAGALVLGIARALKEMDPNLEEGLREKGFLTRDGRMKERKKYGRRGARRSFQFSKR